MFLKCTDDRLQQFTISANDGQLVLQSIHVTDEAGKALTFFHKLGALRATSINSTDYFNNLFCIRLTQLNDSNNAMHRNLFFLRQEQMLDCIAFIHEA